MQTEKLNLPKEAIELYNSYIHGEISRRDFMDGAKRYAVGGLAVATIVEALMPKYLEAQQVSKTDRAAEDQLRDCPVADGQRQHQGVSRTSSQRWHEQAARHPCRPRKPRAQPAHRGHRASPRARQLHGVRSRRTDVAWWIPRRRRQGRADVRHGRPEQDDRGLRGIGHVAEESGRLHRQDRRDRFLLWRRHRQYARRAVGRGHRGCGAVLRRQSDRWRTCRRSRLPCSCIMAARTRGS